MRERKKKVSARYSIIGTTRYSAYHTSPSFVGFCKNKTMLSRFLLQIQERKKKTKTKKRHRWELNPPAGVQTLDADSTPLNHPGSRHRQPTPEPSTAQTPTRCHVISQQQQNTQTLPVSQHYALSEEHRQYHQITLI